MRILFLHGWHSVPGGVKPTYLKDHGHEVINPALDELRREVPLRAGGWTCDRTLPMPQPTVEIAEYPMNDPEYVDLSKLRTGPIRNELLSPELLEQIRAVFDVIGPYIAQSLEQFEIGFMRDMHPESEVALWFRITKAWLAYHEDFLANNTLPDEEERKLLGVLIAISAGVEDVTKLNVPEEVGHRLIRCYDDSAANGR